MIKIIKHGKKEFTAICNKCGCEFIYELSDIGISGVVCPECGTYIYHPSQHNLSDSDSITTIPTINLDFNKN